MSAAVEVSVTFRSCISLAEISFRKPGSCSVTRIETRKTREASVAESKAEIDLPRCS